MLSNAVIRIRFFIKVEANPNNVKRIITVGLEAGDYFDRVTVTQKSN